MAGTLFLVATPIGNLQDISRRGVDILQQADCIACEDTRISRRLLETLGIDKPLLPLHQHNEQKTAAALLPRLEAGENIAVISDAGTPVISDPGVRLVRLAHERGLRVVPVPGANAAVAALCASGLSGDRFMFAGFIPSRGGERERFLRRFLYARETVIFYESPHRIAATVQAMQQCYPPERRLVVARELTKTFEQIVPLTVGGAAAWLDGDENRRRGEFVLLLEAAPAEAEAAHADWQALARDLLAEGMSVKAAAALLARHLGINRKSAYAYLLARRGDDSDKASR